MTSMAGTYGMESGRHGIQRFIPTRPHLPARGIIRISRPMDVLILIPVAGPLLRLRLHGRRHITIRIGEVLPRDLPHAATATTAGQARTRGPAATTRAAATTAVRIRGGLLIRLLHHSNGAVTAEGVLLPGAQERVVTAGLAGGTK